VLAFADMVYLFAYELACLSARRFTFPRIFLRALDGCFIWHMPSS
jgi:hypothetical protein